jgi:hypothetical protein
MKNILIFLLPVILLLLVTPPAWSEALSAEQIYDKLVHYESDQLATVPSITDYTCTLTESETRPGIPDKQTMVKTIYFMIPVYQLQMLGDEPVFFFDQSSMLLLLENYILVKDHDAKIGDVDCWVITLKPKNPAFKTRLQTYYVAKEDSRLVRFINHHPTDQYDDVLTIWNYTYGPAGQFKLRVSVTSETKDLKGNLLSSTVGKYTDYKFNIGLDYKFFADKIENRRPILR